MSKHVAPESISLSYLNAIEYCPRRFYYEFVQGDMIENEFVLEGTLLHERADQAGQHTTQEGEIQINHLYLYSEELRLAGFADIVEEEEGPISSSAPRPCVWKSDCRTRLPFLTDIFSILVRASAYRYISQRPYEQRRGRPLTWLFR